MFGPNDVRIVSCPACGHMFGVLDLIENEGECPNLNCGKILTSGNRAVTQDAPAAEVPFYDQHQNVA